MNKSKQLWAISKFQFVMKPWIFVFPLALAAPYIITPLVFRGQDFSPSLGTSLSNQNIFFLVVIAVMLIDPDGFQTDGQRAAMPSGTDFLLTRAVDRDIVLRARSLLFYALILAIPLLFLAFAFANPGLQISEFNKVSYQAVLERIPGSIAVPAAAGAARARIVIANGNLLVQSWRVWLLLSLSIVIQALILLVHPLRYRRFILWGLYLGSIAIFMALLFSGIRSTLTAVPLSEALFFDFVTYQSVLWPVTLAALFLGQLWCENRFAKSEQ